jgi:hypothetical protein
MTSCAPCDIAFADHVGGIDPTDLTLNTYFSLCGRNVFMTDFLRQAHVRHRFLPLRDICLAAKLLFPTSHHDHIDIHHCYKHQMPVFRSATTSKIALILVYVRNNAHKQSEFQWGSPKHLTIFYEFIHTFRTHLLISREHHRQTELNTQKNLSSW